MTTIVNVGYDSTNYYVLGGTLLIDIGFPGTLPKLQHQCKRMSVNLAAIQYVLCTHYHPDHAGLAQELKRTGVKLLVLSNQVAFIPTLRTYMKPEQKYIDIELKDNVVIEFDASRAWLKKLGIAGEIVPTPGHSDDSVALVLDSGEVFTGDLPHPRMTDDAVTTQSWQRIRALGAKTAYPGHGPAVAIS